MSNKKKITCRLLSDYDQPIPLSGEIIVMMHVGETSYIYDTIVAKIMDDCILGLDFMKNKWFWWSCRSTGSIVGKMFNIGALNVLLVLL